MVTTACPCFIYSEGFDCQRCDGSGVREMNEIEFAQLRTYPKVTRWPDVILIRLTMFNPKIETLGGLTCV